MTDRTTADDHQIFGLRESAASSEFGTRLREAVSAPVIVEVEEGVHPAENVSAILVVSCTIL